ncbi:DNA-binding LacI/PurR family transcriptional regulator [Arthrobacter silviterrae]|uniref:LacI family transcriptional regulator n=1 Tax=Arthrobacter silviterrae TaxID=2026658 RepID=A0ABX0D8E9_9MICC|nr:LacI family DNA-binding transcriptional regulator [Arthrobacter silviterrae]MDQ0277295.1 DNA-binding LacI/PurR family transcriptional regulator [Arthrobacter silviterrae]NGN82906.1 LacI family transcriptional regulator [Arthrobacter silviterrae]
MERKFNRGPAMRDVARAAGVSAQTVSRVLSNHPNVQESTRQRVMAAADELDYRRNNMARALVTGRSKTLGVLTLATNNYSRSSLALGVELGAREAGYTVNSVTSGLSAEALTGAVSRLVNQGVDGIIIAAPLRDAASTVRRLTMRVPTVNTDGSSGISDGLVGVDQDLAAVLATRHLLELGHATVWHVAGPEDWSDSAARLGSWRRTLEEAGREVPPELHGDWSPESGYRNGLVLGRMPEVTAILVASDEMAFGVIRALSELGRRIPEDVSVVGIDDIDLAAYSNPPLTTVRQSFEDTGRRAVTHLVELIANPGMDNPPDLAAPVLVVRGSTAPPPAA